MSADTKTRRKPLNYWLFAAIGLIVVFTAGVFLFAQSYFIVDELAVPNLVGMPHAEATAKLRDLGIEPISFVEQVSGVPSGTVTSQSIQSGTFVKTGRTIHLGVNNPPENALIPRLIDLNRDEALAWLDELNVPVGEIEYRYSDRAAGLVIAQQPDAGTLLGSLGAVYLTVSSGVRVGEIEIPDVIGDTIQDAQNFLARMGFTQVELVAQEVSAANPETVIAMHPEPGVKVVGSTPIVLSYAASTAVGVRVPDLHALSLREAQLNLAAAGLQLGHVTEVDTADFPAGIVQYAPDGITLPGTRIAVTINQLSPADREDLTEFDELFRDLIDEVGERDDGDVTADGDDQTPEEIIVQPEPRRGNQLVELPPAGDGARIVNFAFDPTFLGIPRLLNEPYELELIVQDDRGERSLFKTMADAGRPVASLIPVYGDAMLQTYIDGVFFQAWSP